jgi:hypothetical protein
MPAVPKSITADSRPSWTRTFGRSRSEWIQSRSPSKGGSSSAASQTRIAAGLSISGAESMIVCRVPSSSSRSGRRPAAGASAGTSIRRNAITNSARSRAAAASLVTASSAYGRPSNHS